jgi:tripartite-type tricarboxylate transporter receptor subunit TctC
MYPEIRARVLGVACACAVLLAPAPARADWQPSQTIEIVVAAGPGGELARIP